MKHFLILILLVSVTLISACTPHPASGVWQTAEKNEYGINRLVVGFDGRASFDTPKLNNSAWRCFWNASSRQEARLDCTPSTNPEQEEHFLFTINEPGLAELHHNARLIATFSLSEENPSAKQ